MRIGHANRDQRVEGVGRPLANQLDIGDGKAGLIRGREPAHLQALRVRSDRPRPVRRFPGRHEDDLVEVGALDGRLGRAEMAEVDGIESPAEHPHLHGWYSNSAVPMRTVSPGWTPAFSSAALTPILSSST